MRTGTGVLAVVVLAAASAQATQPPTCGSILAVWPSTSTGRFVDVPVVVSGIPTTVRRAEPSAAAQELAVEGRGAAVAEAALREVYDRLITASRYRRANRLVPELGTYLLDGVNPAKSWAANTRGNPEAKAKVVVSCGLFQFALDVDELAFCLAHEIAHLVYDHQTKAEKFYKEELPQWAQAEGWDLTAAQIESRFKRDVFDDYLNDLELEADAGALILMNWAGFDQRAAARVSARASPAYNPAVRTARLNNGADFIEMSER